MIRLLCRTVAAGAALSALALSPGAYAADELDIEQIKPSGDGTVEILVGVSGLPAGTEIYNDAWEVTVDGESVEVTTLESGTFERTTMLAIDASQSMQGDPFEAAKEAARAFLESAPSDIQVGLVTFAAGVEVTEPTDDREALSEALDEIDLTPSTHLYDGIVDAVTGAGAEGFRSVLVLSDGKDRGSEATLEDAIAAATANGVVVDVVTLDEAAAPRELLEEIAATSGGQVIDAAASELEQVFKAQADARRGQVLLQFDQPADADGDTDIDVSLVTDGGTFTASAVGSFDSLAGAAPRPVDSESSGLGGSALLAGALALGVGLAAILAVLFLGDRGQSRAQRQISAYLGSTEPGGDSQGQHAATSAQGSLRESAVAMTEKVVKGGDLESRLNAKLVGGGIALTPAEWLLVHGAIAIASAFVGFIVGGGIFLVVGLIAGVLFPYVYLRRKHSSRLAAFNSQLAETLDLLAGGLAAGLSMPQAVDSVVREGVDPMAGELRRALIEQRLGVDIEDALDGIAERMDSGDFSWVVMAIRIQREVGGNLAELLRTVADTLRERDYLRRQVRVLSAEGRISAYVLGGLPIAMFLYLLAVRRDFVQVLYTTPTGWAMLGAAAVLLFAGFWVMSRMIKIEV